MTAAYDGLSDTFKTMIAGPRAIRDFQNFRILFSKSPEDQAKLRRMEEMFANPSHPVVRTRPASGRKGIYINPQFTLRIEGLHPEESRALLDVLFELAHVPEYQFRLRGSGTRSCSGTISRAKQTVAGAAQKKLRQINDRRARNLEIMPQTRLRRSRCTTLGTSAVLLAVAHLGLDYPFVERAV
jgi:Taurine catabolism dioxygenase TauD, TfdA family